MRTASFVAVALVVCVYANPSFAQDADPSAPASPSNDGESRPPPSFPTPAGDQGPGPAQPKASLERDVRADIPIVAYTYAATGAQAKTVGAYGYGLVLAASQQDAVVGGGATVWGSPIQRLTIIADASRNIYGNLSPSVAVVGHLLGDPDDGFSLGALGKFKIDGFASGPSKDEIESEIEIGALLSFAKVGWHLDVNAIAGRGLGDDGETDTEGRLRFGRDLGQFVRLSLDGQTRVRVGGPKYLPNGRIWDFALGPQLFVGSGSFYGALTAGPATMGLISRDVGFTTVLAVGGTT